MNWLAIWGTFKADPFIWLIYLQGLLTVLVIISGKKANWFLGVTLFATTFSAAAWMLSTARDQHLTALTYAGLGWLMLSFIWLFFGIHSFRKAHPKKPVKKL